MFYPSRYEDHNNALKNFIKLFNLKSIAGNHNLKMSSNLNENYYDDGNILNEINKREISFDFEKRFKYFDTYGFKFKTLGQFERKIIKSKIKLSIQCSTDEKSFLVAWHEDFYKEKKYKTYSSTESNIKENNPKRYTQDFLEIRYDSMDYFLKIISNSFNKNQYNKSTFK
mgnify:CR=1 FL=1|tara:strand:- start:130 stop:639 length:510 start_codon:yes stop_codon:yes gene_type:complete